MSTPALPIHGISNPIIRNVGLHTGAINHNVTVYVSFSHQTYLISVQHVSFTLFSRVK